MVPELSASHIKWDRAELGRVAIAVYELERSVGIDEPTDCPGGRYPIDMDLRSRNEAQLGALRHSRGTTHRTSDPRFIALRQLTDRQNPSIAAFVCYLLSDPVHLLVQVV